MNDYQKWALAIGLSLFTLAIVYAPRGAAEWVSDPGQASLPLNGQALAFHLVGIAALTAGAIALLRRT